MKDRILELKSQGFSKSQIIEILGISAYTASKYLPKIRTSYEEKVKELSLQGLSFNEIVKETGFSRSTVSKYYEKIDSPLKPKVKKQESKSSVMSSWKRDIRKRRILFLKQVFGSKCQKCGYDKCQSALHFHHLDENEKDFQISTTGKKSMGRLVAEVKKCTLLCANCHTEVHEGLWTTEVPHIDWPEIPEELIHPPSIELSPDIMKKESSWVSSRLEEIQREKTVVNENDGIIDFKKLSLKDISKKKLFEICDNYHYLRGSRKGSIFNFGLFEDQNLIGVCQVTNPVRQGSEGYLEISRFLLLKNIKNLGSKFLSLIVQEIKKRKKDCKGVQSFSDDSIHSGTIYKAANFKSLEKKYKTYSYSGIHKKTIYQRALAYGMSEYEYAEKFGLEKRLESPKTKFIYEF